MHYLSTAVLIPALLATGTALAQSDFASPGVEKPLEELVEVQDDFDDAEALDDFGTDAPGKATTPDARATETAAQPETPKLIEVPGVVWVNVTPEEEDLAGVTFDVPRNWTRDDDSWQLEGNGMPAAMLNVASEDLGDEEMDLDEFLKSFPEDVGKTAVIEDVTVAGKSAIQVKLHGDLNGQTIYVTGLLFTDPIAPGRENLMVSFGVFGENPKMEQVFARFKQSIRFDFQVPKAFEGAELIVLSPITEGDADGAITVLKEMGDYPGIKYTGTALDLNADGAMERIIRTQHNYLCSRDLGNCRTFVLRKTGSDWTALTYPYTRSISLLPSQTNGWRDLLVDNDLYSFDGRRYQKGQAVESAATPQPAAVAPTSTSPDAPQISGWGSYVNARFGTTVDLPEGLFDRLPPPENGDGQVFQSDDPSIRLMIFAGHNALNETMADRLSTMISQGGFDRISKAPVTEDRFELKGERDGMHIWHVELLDAQDVIHTVEITYDNTAQAAFESDLERIIQSLSVSFPQTDTEPVQPDKGQAELAFWQSIARSADPRDFSAYLEKWPDGVFAQLARNSIDRLTTVAAPVPTAPVPSGSIRTPAKKTAERSAIMDAARIPITRALGQHVIFVVSIVQTDGEWAYLQAVPHQPDGTPLNWNTTPFAWDWNNDVMSDLVMVLMHNDGSGWRAIDHVVGPTDVHWIGWVQQYGLSHDLFTNQ